jgi:hypothetical protein
VVVAALISLAGGSPFLRVHAWFLRQRGAGPDRTVIVPSVRGRILDDVGQPHEPRWLHR